MGGRNSSVAFGALKVAFRALEVAFGALEVAFEALEVAVKFGCCSGMKHIQ